MNLRITLALAVAVSLTSAAVSARAEHVLTFERVPVAAVDASQLLSAPDGAIWTIGVVRDTAGVVRIDRSGAVQQIPIPGVNLLVDPIELTVLADGSIGFVTTARSLIRMHWVRVRVPAGGGAPTVTPLLVTKQASSQAALTPDGTTWIAFDCLHRLLRIGPDGAVARFRVPGSACKPSGPQPQPHLTIGGDGTVWYVDLCEGVLARFPLVESRRSWRYRPRSACYVPPSSRVPLRPIRATPDGGLRFPGGRIDAAGRLRLDGSQPSHAITLDGAAWSVLGPASIERVRAGLVQRLTPPRTGALVGWTIGADGDFWYAAGRARFGGTRRTWDVRIGSVNARGLFAEQALPPAIQGVEGPMLTALPLLAPAGDGSMWMTERRRLVTRRDAYVDDLVRIVPQFDIPAPPPRAAPLRVIGRRAARVWIAVGCVVRPGQFCTGTLQVDDAAGRALALAVSTFSIPSGEQRAVSVALRPLALGHPVRATTACIGLDGVRTTVRQTLHVG